MDKNIEYFVFLERAIRQEREEKRIIRQEKQLKEQTLNAAEQKNLLGAKKGGRNFTISIAIPGSVIGIVQSRELKTYVAGQVGKIIKLWEYVFFTLQKNTFSHLKKVVKNVYVRTT